MQGSDPIWLQIVVAAMSLVALAAIYLVGCPSIDWDEKAASKRRRVKSRKN